MGTDDFLFQKGVFLYEYFTDISKFQESRLPLKDAFFNRLTNEFGAMTRTINKP